MKSLESLGINPFLEAMLRASRENNIQFGDDTVGRFMADNPGSIFTAQLDLLKDNLQGYKTGVVGAQTGEQKLATKSVEAMVKIIADTGRRLYSKIQDAYKNTKAPELIVFFPQGLSIFSYAGRGQYTTIIDTWIEKANKHPYSDKLGKEWQDELAELKVNWNDSIGVQSGAKEGVDKGIENADSFIFPMAQNLWMLFLQVVINNQPNAQNAIGKYFDTTPLNRKDNHDNDGLGRTFGTAKDAAGAGLPAVFITLKDAAGQITWKGKTDKGGKWRTKNVAVGMYHVTFEKPGYVSQTLSHEILDDGDTAVDVVLVVG